MSPLLSWLYRSEQYSVKRVNTPGSSVRYFSALVCRPRTETRLGLMLVSSLIV